MDKLEGGAQLSTPLSVISNKIKHRFGAVCLNQAFIDDI